MPSPNRLAPTGAAPAAAHDDVLAHAWSVLESVPDPEIPVVSIRELGILRAVERAQDGTLEVVITPTYSGCPAMAHIAEDIAHALEHAGLTPHRIKTVLAPAWTTDWITDEAREKLRAYGIAPPGGRCANVAGDDPFARLYASVDADINQCVDVRSRPLALRQRPGALDLNLTTVCLAFGTESGNGEAREEPGRGSGA